MTGTTSTTATSTAWWLSSCKPVLRSRRGRILSSPAWYSTKPSNTSVQQPTSVQRHQRAAVRPAQRHVSRRARAQVAPPTLGPSPPSTAPHSRERRLVQACALKADPNRARPSPCTGAELFLTAEGSGIVRKTKTLIRYAALIGGATALVLAANATAMAANWTRADLTARTGAPTVAIGPWGYTTDLTGQGPVARVVYAASSGHVWELSVRGGNDWKAADLTART